MAKLFRHLGMQCSAVRMASSDKSNRERENATSSSPTDSGSSRLSPYSVRRRRNPAVLIRWIEEHPYNPYPTKAEKHYLAFYAGMTQRQLNDWFANARRNIKKVGYEAWKKKHSGFSAILSGIPLQSTGPNFPVGLFPGTVATLAPNVNCKPPTTAVPSLASGGAVANGTQLAVNMNGTLPLGPVNGTLLSHCDAVSNGCSSITTTCSNLPTPFYQSQDQSISINSTLKPAMQVASYGTAPTLGLGAESTTYASSAIGRSLHPPFPLTVPWVPPPVPTTSISGPYKVVVPAKNMDSEAAACNCAQCQQLQATSSATLSHGAQASPADGVQQWSPGDQNSECAQSSPLAVPPRHSITSTIDTVHWNGWQSLSQQQPQLNSCAEEEGTAEKGYYEQSPSQLCR